MIHSLITWIAGGAVCFLLGLMSWVAIQERQAQKRKAD